VKLLAADPEDFKTKSEYEWVIFGCIKLVVSAMREALDKPRPVDERDVGDLMAWMEEYRGLGPRIPGMACSSILAQLTKVGSHLPKFPAIIHWVGIDGLRPEDWRPNEFEGRTFPSLSINIARALCKWVTAHAKASERQMAFALEWAERVKQRALGDDVLWLNWDMAILLRQMGEFQRAAELLAIVIKAKRNEAWVWAEAGRLYHSEQPELALACFCRALECPAEPKFLVRAHRELAELLAEQEEYAQASREVAITIDIRQAEGWPVGREMEGLIASPWYDPSAEGADEPKAFYSKNSPAALALCFDVVETKAATCLGLLIPQMPNDPRPGWKPKLLPRFAIKDSNGHAWTLIGPGMKKMKFEIGTPLTIVIGRQSGDDRQTIVHISVRNDGKPWDCLEPAEGVVTLEATAEKSMKVFVAGLREELRIAGATEKPLRICDGVRFGLVRNPKNHRVELFNVEPGELPDNDVKFVKGQLCRKPNGSAVVDDAYVPPYLVGAVVESVDEVGALAIYARNPARGGCGWRVVKLNTG
jgi:tetratricopeptide (TPR) repeat protein